MPDKLPQLQAMLEKQPNDPFLLYAIALEHKKANDAEKALIFLDRTIAAFADPNYCYAYFQRGQVCEMSGDLDAAKRAYNEGIVSGPPQGRCACARGVGRGVGDVGVRMAHDYVNT